MVRHEHPVESLEQLNEESGYEPQAHSPVDIIEQRILWERILAQLPDPLEREALDRRYRGGESIEEIVEAFQVKTPGVKKRDVYRLLERALRRMRNNPLIQQMVIDLRS
jgi:DNA-directed RNA polymerase specialized sigma24 family protein